MDESGGRLYLTCADYGCLSIHLSPTWLNYFLTWVPLVGVGEPQLSDLCKATSHKGSRAAEMPLAGLSTVASGRAFMTALQSSGFPIAIRAVDSGCSAGLMHSSMHCARKVGVLMAVLSSRVSNVFMRTFPPISTLNASRFVAPALPTLAEAPVEADLDSSFCISYPGSFLYCHSQHVFFPPLKVPRSPV